MWPAATASRTALCFAAAPAIQGQVTMVRKTDNDMRLLTQQTRVLGRLIKRGWTKTELSARLRVRPATVSAWFADPPVLATTRVRTRIEDLLNAQPPPRNLTAPRGSSSKAERAEADILERQHGLITAQDRIVQLATLCKQRHWSHQDLATHLQVSVRTVEKYFDQDWTGHIAPAPLRRLAVLLTERVKSESPEERFARATRKLFGKYFNTGFPDKSNLKVQVIQALALATGLNERTIYRYMPPYKLGIRPGRDVIESYELLASKLAPGTTFVDLALYRSTGGRPRKRSRPS
jgi:ribosome-binding protein aMBF1 (putative translation factor)